MDSHKLTARDRSEERGTESHTESGMVENPSRHTAATVQSPNWLQVFLAPWLGIVRPRQAVDVLVSGSVFAIIAATVFLISLLAAVVLSLRIWIAMLEFDFNTKEVFRYTVGEVWRLWHRDGLFGTAEAVVIWTWCLSLGAIAIIPWLCFPRLYMGGSIWASYWKTFRSCLSCAGLAFLLASVGAAILALAIHIDTLSGIVMRRFDGAIVVIGIAFLGMLSAYLLILRVIAAVDFIRAPVPVSELPPRCEACGYDLTHQSEGGLCSECGISIEESLTPGRKRSGCDWENRGGVAAWMKTTYEVLLKTERFYEKLPVRTPDDQARRFARWHYTLLGLLGSLFIFLGICGESDIFAVVCAPLLVFLLWPLIGWFALQGISTLVIFWWVARGSSMRVYLTRKIISYESAYLTVVGALFAMLFASYFRYAAWITETFGNEFFAKSFGLQAEAIAVVLGIALSTGIWLWRITVGIRSVRWGNS